MYQASETLERSMKVLLCSRALLKCLLNRQTDIQVENRELNPERSGTKPYLIDQSHIGLSTVQLGQFEPHLTVSHLRRKHYCVLQNQIDPRRDQECNSKAKDEKNQFGTLRIFKVEILSKGSQA